MQDSLLADQTSFEIRSDNAVQFSKTTALLGAAGKISTTRDRRQPPKRPFGNLFLPRNKDRKTPICHKKTAASLGTGGSENDGYSKRLAARPDPFARAIEEIVFHRGKNSLALCPGPVNKNTTILVNGIRRLLAASRGRW